MPPSSQWTTPLSAVRYANAENATRPFAHALVSKATWSNPVAALDLATGTGVVVSEIYLSIPKARWDSVKVTGGDVSQPMLDYVKKRGEDNGWTGLETRIVDGNDMSGMEGEGFTHVLCTFGVFMMPDAVKGLYGVMRPGGFVGVTTWKSLGWYVVHLSCLYIHLLRWTRDV
jgi:ubiquinone/menaquinone biosynthesis C-methylase UbiE